MSTGIAGCAVHIVDPYARFDGLAVERHGSRDRAERRHLRPPAHGVLFGVLLKILQWLGISSGDRRGY